MTVLVYAACGFTLGISALLCIAGLRLAITGDLSQVVAGPEVAAEASGYRIMGWFTSGKLAKGALNLKQFRGCLRSRAVQDIVEWLKIQAA